MTSRICAWIVTSSAVVGSSAISSAGLQDSAMAIITRCRMPPENSCGYCLRRFSGLGMPTRASRSMARCLACALSSFMCRTIASVSCRPTVSTGLSEVIGSWKIIAMRLPRSARISFSSSFSRSWPLNSIVPAVIWPPGAGTSRMIESEVTLLPEPLSPTMPSVSPASSEKLTSSTARSSPCSILKTVLRWETLSSWVTTRSSPYPWFRMAARVRS